jgi:hypothetical protein
MTRSKPTFGTAYATSESFVDEPPSLAAAVFSEPPPTSSLAPPQAATARASRATARAVVDLTGRTPRNR